MCQHVYGSHSNTQRHDLHNFGFLASLDLLRGHTLQHTTIQAKVTRFSVSVVHVESSQFNKGHSKEDLDIGGPANRANGTKDVLVGVSFTGDMNTQLLNNNTANGKHADTAVLDFGPTGIVQVSLDVGTELFVVRDV